MEIELLGEKVLIERIGTDGDMKKAARIFRDLDGKVDALGVGGADLGLRVASHWYPLYSISPMLKDVHQTPVVDGSGLKTTLEKKAASIIDARLGSRLTARKVLIMAGTDRWGMAEGFLQKNYDCLFGDLMFSLGIPIPIHQASQVKSLAAVLLPVVGRFPFRWIYPVGKEQEKRTPGYESYFNWSTVIAGDCHYITRYMPEHLSGRIIVTNTTTREDMDLFRSAGISHVITTTPVFDGRSFGTNLMEAAIIAALGRKDPVDYAHPAAYFSDLEQILPQIHLEP